MRTPRRSPRSDVTPSPFDHKAAARAAIDRYLHSLDEARDGEDQSALRPTWHQPQPDQWTISIVGSSHQIVNVELSLGEYTLQLMTFFMRKPDENVGEVYRLLLRRNLELSTVKFGVDEFGDIYLRADLPTSGVTEAALDRTIGVFYSCADSNWQPVMRLGFAGAFTQ